MESRVRDVSLNNEVTLDIGGLMDYSGQGKCIVLKCWADRYREQLMTWVKSRSGCGWEWFDENFMTSNGFLLSRHYFKKVETSFN